MARPQVQEIGLMEQTEKGGTNPGFFHCSFTPFLCTCVPTTKHQASQHGY